MKIFIILFLLTIFSCSAASPKLYSNLPDTQNSQQIIERDLFISPQFSIHEKELIKLAILEWKSATGNRVIFHIKDLYGNNEHLNSNSIEIYPAPSTHTIVKLEDEKTKSKNVYGLCWKVDVAHPVIWIIYDRLKNDKAYKLTVIHELGHSLYLDHSEDVNTIMYPYLNENLMGLTAKDLKNFCQKYLCD